MTVSEMKVLLDDLIAKGLGDVKVFYSQDDEYGNSHDEEVEGLDELYRYSPTRTIVGLKVY